MMAHCAEVQEVSNGKALENTPLVVKLLGGVIRKMVFSDKPFPKNTRTHPQYRQTGSRDFATEKKRLIEALDQFVSADGKSGELNPHPLFGKVSEEEGGWGMYKHLDHHLKQFGV